MKVKELEQVQEVTFAFSLFNDTCQSAHAREEPVETKEKKKRIETKRRWLTFASAAAARAAFAIRFD